MERAISTASTAKDTSTTTRTTVKTETRRECGPATAAMETVSSRPLEITSEDGDVVSDLLLAHKLEHVPTVVGGRLPLPLQEFDVHQRLSTLDCNRLPFVTQVDELQGESANVAAVYLRGVQKREPHPSVLALGSEMRDKLRGSEDYLVRH